MKRRNAERGFTIIEVIVIVVIIGVLAAVIAPRLLSKVGESRRSVAKSDIAVLWTAMQNYAINHGLPEPGSSIDILWTRPANIDEVAWKGPYINNADDLKDPWGNLYILRVPSEEGADYDVLSLGSDGAPGGEGDAADIISGKK